MNAIATMPGLSSIVLDGVGVLTDVQLPPKEVLLNWIGSVMQEESAYSYQLKSSMEMALLLRQHKIRTYVLKGNTVAECYPKPNHRKSADLDCFLMADYEKEDVWEKGNSIIERNGFDV